MFVCLFLILCVCLLKPRQAKFLAATDQIIAYITYLFIYLLVIIY